MDKKRTERYYALLTAEDICQCAYCRNYCRQIRDAYPETAAYLDSLGVDIEKPFETFPLEPEPDGTILYADVQYVLLGSADDFVPPETEGVTFRVTDSHPMTGLEEAHFVLEASSFRLKWLEEGKL